MQRRENAVIVGVEAIERLLGREVHLMTTKKAGEERPGQWHPKAVGLPIVGLRERPPASGTSEVDW
jgi:hypothetical protein